MERLLFSEQLVSNIVASEVETKGGYDSLGCCAIYGDGGCFNWRVYSRTRALLAVPPALAAGAAIAGCGSRFQLAELRRTDGACLSREGSTMRSNDFESSWNGI